MKSFFDGKFQIKIESSFKCDNPTFDYFDDALDCYYKAIGYMIHRNFHDVKISLVQVISDDEIVIFDRFIE